MGDAVTKKMKMKDKLKNGVVQARGLEVGGYKLGNFVTSKLQDAVERLYRFVVEMNMKATRSDMVVVLARALEVG